MGNREIKGQVTRGKPLMKSSVGMIGKIIFYSMFVLTIIVNVIRG